MHALVGIVSVAACPQCGHVSVHSKRSIGAHLGACDGVQVTTSRFAARSTGATMNVAPMRNSVGCQVNRKTPRHSHSLVAYSLRAQRPEACAKFFCKELRLFPRREMATLCHLVVVDEIGIGPLGPAPRRLVELVRENAHGNRDFDALGSEKGELVL